MEHRKAFLASPFSVLLFVFITLSLYGKGLSYEDVTAEMGPVVEKDQRRTLTVTEYGEISAIDIKEKHRPPYHLQFFTLEPNSLFLPVLLHAHMVFYVQTGSGRLIWVDEDDTRRVDLRRGDICRLRAGSVFYLESNLETERQNLRIYAIFASTDDNTYDPSISAYSRVSELVRGFDKRIMKAAFKVPDELIEAIQNKTDTPPIVHAVSKEKTTFWELDAWFLRKILRGASNSKKTKTYNIFDKDPDFENCNGWSLTVTKKEFKSLKGIDIGLLMVNLTTGSMMGPHWNPRATEIAVVLQGEGMVRVVCGSSNNDKSECQNMRFKVKQGDVFVVPRFHPMAQMSFNNDSLVFLGFSTATKNNYPQFLAGKRSVLQTLDREVLATSFNVSNTTIDQLLASQDDSIILECVSCAEEEERLMKEEIIRKREEEARKREEERRREEEEARKREEQRGREEEEARKREEQRRREEEEARKREKERKRQEKEARKREEEERRRQEEEEERKREEQAEREQEQARREQAERERRKEQEEEEERQEEAARKKKERGERGRGREEEAEWEQERARRQQEQRENRREEEEGKGRSKRTKGKAKKWQQL